MDHIGMDTGMMSSHICEVTEAGDVVERQIRTERRRLQEVFGSRPKARILIAHWRKPVGSVRIGRRTGRHGLNETCARSWGFASYSSERGRDGLSTSGLCCGATDSVSRLGARSCLRRA